MTPPDYLQTEIIRLDQKIAQAQQSLSDPDLKVLAQEEIKQLESQKQSLLSSASNTSSISNISHLSYDSRPATIEIRAAAGGDEAKIWAADLLRMYTRYCEQKNLKHQLIDELVLQISSPNTFKLLKHESGVHRVQRIPATENLGRIHTSTATVAVLPQISAQEVDINPGDLDWQFTRSGGPGGQNVNKLNTAVRLTHRPTQTTISVRQERSQQQNREIALQMLRSTLWQLEQDKKQQTLDSTRRSAIGRGMRAEKIRTYNFPQNRVTDHRIKKSWHNLDSILDGHLDKIFSTLEKSQALPQPSLSLHF